MEIPFWRYSATGNTFLAFDNRKGTDHLMERKIYAALCQKENVDGLLFLEISPEEDCDFHMRYLNADGGEVDMCGNGARSIVHFANTILKILPNESDVYTFSTKSSIYRGHVSELYPILMTEVKDFDLIPVDDLLETNFSAYINTGVPHAIFEVKELAKFPVHKEGKRIRNDQRFSSGVNANFFEVVGENHVRLRTFERGVEGETHSCGTGATGVALVLSKKKNFQSPVRVDVVGGQLHISFTANYSEVYLAGRVNLVGNGVFQLPS